MRAERVVAGTVEEPFLRTGTIVHMAGHIG